MGPPLRTSTPAETRLCPCAAALYSTKMPGPGNGARRGGRHPELPLTAPVPRSLFPAVLKEPLNASPPRSRGRPDAAGRGVVRRHPRPRRPPGAHRRQGRPARAHRQRTVGGPRRPGPRRRGVGLLRHASAGEWRPSSRPSSRRWPSRGPAPLDGAGRPRAGGAGGRAVRDAAPGRPVPGAAGGRSSRSWWRRRGRCAGRT